MPDRGTSIGLLNSPVHVVPAIIVANVWAREIRDRCIAVLSKHLHTAD